MGLIGLGALFLALAWVVLVEYRKAFFTDPLSIMSIEVLANIVRLGGPGYLAMLLLVAGLPMLLGGVLFLLAGASIWAYENAAVVLRAISTTLGLGQ